MTVYSLEAGSYISDEDVTWQKPIGIILPSGVDKPAINISAPDGAVDILINGQNIGGAAIPMAQGNFWL